LYDCDATLLLNIYIYLVFVGEGWMTLVPSNLRHLRHLWLHCENICDEYVKELVVALPELEMNYGFVDIVAERSSSEER
jgi:hypothetical protein